MTGQTPPVVDEERNRSALQRIFLEVYNAKKYDVAHELVAPECVFHNTLQATPFIGPQGVIDFMKVVHTGWPDSYFTLHEVIAEGDLVASRQVFHGTNTGLLHGKHKPTGKYAETTEVAVVRFAGGKAVEAFQVLNAMNILQQIGIVPPEEQLQAMARIPKPVKALVRFFARMQSRR